MKRLLITGLVMILSIAPTSRAQSNFDGIWKVDFESAMPTKTNVWLLQGGVYRCISCTPAIEVKADGTDQPVKGQPFDSISVKVLDGHTIQEVEKKNGQTVSDEKLTISADGIPSQMNLRIGS